MAVNVLVVGAHPDDIEIAVGGTVAKLIAVGARAVVVVASDEGDPAIATVRRRETAAGLRSLGIDAGSTLFLGLPDRSIGADVRSVERLASALIAVRFTPDIVITHSEHDRHRDHRAVAQIVRAVTGNGPLGLGMAVVNSVEDTFAPELFVETSRYVAAKAEALRAHRSQDERGRIRPAAIREFERGHAAVHGVERVEPFELLRPLSADDAGVLSYLGPCVIRDAAR